MDIVILILGIVLILGGIIGSILPVLPGPPLAFVSLILAIFHSVAKESLAANNYMWFTVFAVFAIGITIIDYYLPIYGTKRFGGTKAGTTGSTVGLIVGVLLMFFIPFVGPFGIIIGPFAGAYLGELYAGQTKQVAWKSGVGSFIGFLGGTFLKVFYGIAIAIYFLIIVF